MDKDQEIAMGCLPSDGRWQSEAQLIHATQLGHRTVGVYSSLVKMGLCERRVVPIFFGMVDLREFLRCYRLPVMFGRAYRRKPNG
jgi:hypothetical protein